MADSFSQAARSATNELRQLFEPTPLQRNDHLSAQYGAEIWLKREDLTPVRSYKLRGAFTAMAAVLAQRSDQNVFVCASAGNHAQGVAFACRHFGVTGVIFMPVTTPEQKIAKTRIFGGDNIEIRLVGDYFDDTLAASQAYCAEAGGHFLAPFDDADVILGQASVGVEILDQLGKEPDVVILPVGGGGLSAGLTRLFRETGAASSFRYVEPFGGASLTAALAHGAPETLESVDSFVDGAAVARIGALPFEILKNVAMEHVILSKEDSLCATMIDMLNVEGIVLEPAGALAINALEQIKDQVKGKTVICVTSGGNFDFERLPEVKERAQRFLGRKKYFILRLPQRPGALRDFLGLLGPHDDIARFEYLKKSARNFGSVLIGIETTSPDAFETLFSRLDNAGFVYRDITNDDTVAQFII